LPDGTVDRIEGFGTEGEAGRWIKNDSLGWLHSRKNRVADGKDPLANTYRSY